VAAAHADVPEPASTPPFQGDRRPLEPGVIVEA
jgi:hypothetical protein